MLLPFSSPLCLGAFCQVFMSNSRYYEEHRLEGRGQHQLIEGQTGWVVKYNYRSRPVDISPSIWVVGLEVLEVGRVRR